MSLTLYLLNKKGFRVLNALVASSEYLRNIDLIVGAKDKGSKEDYYYEIRKLCDKHDIRHIERGDKLPLKSKFTFAIGWRWLINDWENLIVLHDSYLPKYRGFSPIVNMLINGENYVGATAIWASEKMDEGDIILQKKKEINYPTKIENAIDLVAELYAEIVLELMNSLMQHKELDRIPQKNEQATYSIWRNEEDYFINWNDEAAQIVRFVDAVGYPYEGAKTRTGDGEIIRIKECQLVENIVSEVYAPGKLLMFDGNYPIILCGCNAVKLLKFEDVNGSSYIFKNFRTRLN
jgi:methionyl-tRNA formyltransferase